jgi:hypothetical protein
VFTSTPAQRDDRWEAFDIATGGNGDLHLIGSNPRGTAFAVYTLCERIGIDPLHHWTGYEPEHRDRLVLKSIHFSANPPTVKYRGMFHDDEDILPRPFEPSGYPDRLGSVPTEWYERYFETALRLRMNMVAPYTRVTRRYEVQKLASDWGLFYTSHHYDILLSNPFGIKRYGLGEKRNSGETWDWLTNRDGMLRYWRGGVEENKDLDCIWPVGLRGVDDYGYRFPKDMPEAEQGRIFKEVVAEQARMTKEVAPPGKPRCFHWTLYTRCCRSTRPGTLEVPKDVMIVWPDDNEGVMRGLPTKRDDWKHGVYYHLAYLGKPVKQNAHIVSPARVAEQFRKIVDSGATEYMLVNVSEQREFVMEARMIAEICWDAKTALAGDDPAGDTSIGGRGSTSATPPPPKLPSHTRIMRSCSTPMTSCGWARIKFKARLARSSRSSRGRIFIPRYPRRCRCSSSAIYNIETPSRAWTRCGPSSPARSDSISSNTSSFRC